MSMPPLLVFTGKVIGGMPGRLPFWTRLGTADFRGKGVEQISQFRKDGWLRNVHAGQAILPSVSPTSGSGGFG